MFLGQYRHQLDPKGRVAVPATFRKGLPQGSVIGVGPDRRLMIWPPTEWDEMAARFRRTGASPAEERAYIRQLYANAREVELDAQGRLLLTQEQRDFAAIADRVVFVGAGTCVEVVGEQIWDGENSAVTPDDFTALHDRVNGSAAAPDDALEVFGEQVADGDITATLRRVNQQSGDAG